MNINFKLTLIVFYAFIDIICNNDQKIIIPTNSPITIYHCIQK